MRIIKQPSFLGAIALTALLTLSACGGASLSPLHAAFLKVGKADAIVLACAGETLVIDTGETDDGDDLLAFLAGEGAHTVDTLIITHFDKDHVGGATALIEGMPVKRVLLPAYTSDSTEYKSFTAAMADAGITPETLTAQMSFSFGDATVTVDPPESYDIAGTADDADNELSLITTITHGSVRMLFTGDAENGRMGEWLAAGNALPCTLLKAPHHGKYHKELKNLVSAVSPDYAVICDSEVNPAEEKTMNLLLESGVRVFETKDGNVTAVSNGKKLSVQ